ncbi:MAG TPA: hypothetical protein VFL64_01790 [Rhizobacter sp.]|nr:hypothetical protein [Rhizobacter sp.]
MKMMSRAAWADWLNLVSRRAVIDEGANVVVSLTTHGVRIGRVHRTLESIGRGRVRPQRMILWLGLGERERPLPRELQRLRARGLEVRYAQDCGPHTKYFPYVCSEPKHHMPMVTADDDNWYPDFWLDRLCRAHAAQPELVHCYRARRIQLQDNALAPYATWPFVEDDLPAPTVFATGVSGVIYPPALLDALRDTGTAFQSCCPKADDLWLHATTFRNGFVARQLAPKAVDFETLPSTQSIALWHQNLLQSNNDPQAAATYTESDLSRLRAA